MPASTNLNNSTAESFHSSHWQIKLFAGVSRHILIPIRIHHILPLKLPLLWINCKFCIQIYKLSHFHDWHVLFIFSLNACFCVCNHLTALFCPPFSLPFEENIHPLMGIYCPYTSPAFHLCSLSFLDLQCTFHPSPLVLEAVGRCLHYYTHTLSLDKDTLMNSICSQQERHRMTTEILYL